MKILKFLMICVITFGLCGNQLFAQEEDAKILNRIDRLYGPLTSNTLMDTITVKEYEDRFDIADRKVSLIIDSLPAGDLKEKAILVAYKGVYGSLGRYVHHNGEELMNKIKIRTRGFDLKSSYLDELPYNHLVNLLISYRKMHNPGTSMLEMASFVLKNTEKKEVHKMYVFSALRSNIAYYGYNDSIAKLMDEIIYYCKDKEVIDACEELKKSSLSLAKGNPAPEIEVVDENGNSYKLSDFRGKYVLLDVWVTTCGPCILALPDLIAASERYKEYNNVMIVSLCANQGNEGWLKLLQQKDFAGKMMNVRLTSDYNKFMSDYCIAVWGRYILIGPDGKIVNAWHIAPKDPRFAEVFNREVGIY